METQSPSLTGTRMGTWSRLPLLTPAVTASSFLMAASSSSGQCTARRRWTAACTSALPATSGGQPSAGMPPWRCHVSRNLIFRQWWWHFNLWRKQHFIPKPFVVSIFFQTIYSLYAKEQTFNSPWRLKVCSALSCSCLNGAVATSNNAERGEMQRLESCYLIRSEVFGQIELEKLVAAQTCK